MERLSQIFKILCFSAVFLVAFLVSFVLYTDIHFNPGNDRRAFSPIVSLPEKDEDEVFEKISFLFFGDMMLDRHVGEKIKSHGVDYLFEKLEEEKFFQGYDLVGANLEGAVTNNGAHYPPQNLYDFAFSPETIQGLKKYNFSFFTLANNHFGDQGQRGIIETRKNLDDLSFNYVGCPDGQVGDCSSRILNISDRKIGMAGFSQVYSLINLEEAKNIISELASTTDLAIVNIHWGVEYEHYFNKTQQRYAHALIDAGADVIIGHHPHVVQGMEIYQGKPIFYSLGNFIFDQYFSQATQEGLAVGIDILEDKKEFHLYLLKSKASQSALMNEEEKKKFLEKFISWSDVSEEYKNQIQNSKLTIY